MRQTKITLSYFSNNAFKNQGILKHLKIDLIMKVTMPMQKY